MTLKAVLDAEGVESLDESVRSLYTENDDGNFVLDVEDVDDLPQVKKLAHAFRETKSDRQKAKKTLEKVRDRFGSLVDEDIDLSSVDPERVSEMLPFLTGERDLPKEGEGGGNGPTDEQREQIRANAVKPFKRDLEKTSSERDFWKQAAENEIVTNNLSREFSRAGVKDPDFLELLIDRFRSRCQLQEDDGKLSLVIKDTEYGDVSPSEFVKEWKDTDYAKKFIDGGGNTGGGASGSGHGNQKIKNPWSKEHWNMTEQARILSEDRERARRMAAAEGKSIRE